MSSIVKTLVVPSAGLGTRLRPITYATPKELLRVVDKPVLYYLLAEAYQAGIREVIFITHVGNRSTKNFLASANARALLADFPHLAVKIVETKKREGDGQALLEVERYLSKTAPFAVSMGDILALPGTSLVAELTASYRKTGNAVISVEEISRLKTGQYGVIDPEKTRGRFSRVRGIVEKPEPKDAPSTLAMTGKYILTPDIFEYLKRLQGKMAGELKLAHALDRYAHEHALDAYACKAKHYDTGTKFDLFRTEIIFTLAHKELGVRARKIIRSLQTGAR